MPVEKIQPWEEGLHQFLSNSHQALMDKINVKGDWNEEIEAGLKAAMEAYVKQSAI